MRAFADKQDTDNSKGSFTDLHRSNNLSLLPMDNRPESILQRKIKALANSSPLGNKAKSIKQLKNNSSQSALWNKVQSIANGKNVLQTKRILDDQEWQHFQKAWGTKTINVGTEKKTIKNLSSNEADMAFDAFVTKGEKFGGNKTSAPVYQSEEVNYRSRNKIIRQQIDSYLFLGLIKNDVVILLATRGIARNCNGKSPITWREDEIKNAEVQNHKAECRVEYKNEYDLNTGVFKAEYNFANHDDSRYGPFKEGGLYIDFEGVRHPNLTDKDAKKFNRRIDAGKRMNNSEILFHQMRLAQQLAEENSKVFTEPKIIHRNNVVNNDTLFVMGFCNGATFKDDGDIEGGGVSAPGDTDHFAILGTPNGQSAGYIAQQHTIEETKRPIDHIGEIVRDGSQLRIEIDGIVLNPD